MSSTSFLGRVAFVLPVVAAIGACSGTSKVLPGANDEGDEANEVDATEPTGGRIDASPSRPDSGRPSRPDGGGLDASLDAPGIDDATVDANADAAPLDAAGVDGAPDGDGGPAIEACARKDELETRQCGKCGSQSRVCKVVDGELVWLPWGECIHETGACYPGGIVNEPCGRCGVRPKVCNATCQIDVGVCQDRPGAECFAGDGEWQEALSCPSGLGRSRTCQAVTCRWSTYSEDCQPFRNPYAIDASTVASAGNESVRVATYPLPSTKKLPRLPSYGACPLSATTTFPTSTPATFVEVRNPSTTASLKLTIWQSATPETGNVSMVIAAYVGATQPPASDPERRACTKGVSGSCSSTLCGGSTLFAALENSSAVTLPPGGSALVYNARYSDGGTPDDRFQLNVRTDVVTPVP